MKPFVGTFDERVSQLRIVPCVPRDSERRVAIVYRMMAKEMDHLATTYDQHRQARLMHGYARSARADRSKPTTSTDAGDVVNINPSDEYPEE